MKPPHGILWTYGPPEGPVKVGGYAIQGRAALFVEWIGGDYTNVVGLPLALTARMLAGLGIRPF